MRLLRPLYFFLRKDFTHTKSTKQTSNSHPLRSLCAEKNDGVTVFCSLIFVFVSSFLFVSVFIRVKSFRKTNKQKKNRLKMVLIASIHYTTNLYPYRPTYWASTYTHLFLFAIIYKNLLFL